MRSISDWTITGKAQKKLERLPKKVQKDIVAKLDFYVASKHALSFAKHLTNSELGEYRYRIDRDWRVIFDIHDDVIVITEIGHRSKIYQ